MSVNLQSLTQQHILVIGDVMLDRYVWGDVSRISPEAPVPVIRVGKQTQVVGGAGNVAANLSGLGCRVSLLGIVGDDDAGQSLICLCRDNNIQTDLVAVKNRPTTTKTRIMARKQQLFRMDEEHLDTLSNQSQDALLDVFEKRLADVDAVIISDYGKGVMQTPGLCQALISLCTKNKVPSLIDPKGKDWERYTGATCITPNTSEFEAISETSFGENDHQLIDAVNRVKEKLNVQCLVLTRGSKGMCVADADKTPLFLPTQAREVFDVSGAGDTVIATLSAGVASGMSFVMAAELANTAAGIVVGKVGTQPVSLSELALCLKDQESIHLKRFETQNKVDPSQSARSRIKDWQKKGDSVVFTNGCFDLLHPGHVDLLHKARSLGDRLVVGLNSDSSVKRLKGSNRPILPEKDRAAILSALGCVDLVVLFTEDTPLELLGILRPDILVKGSDYKPEDVVGKDLVESYGGQLHLVDLLEGYSTTGIETKILNRSS